MKTLEHVKKFYSTLKTTVAVNDISMIAEDIVSHKTLKTFQENQTRFEEDYDYWGHNVEDPDKFVEFFWVDIIVKRNAG